MKKRWKCNIMLNEDCLPQIYPFDSKKYDEMLEEMRGKTVAVTIEPWKSTTSNPQYKYYYGVVLALISETTGINKDQLDAILKSKFLYEYVMVAGVPEKHPISKTAVTTEQFSEYIEQVVCWAAEFLDLVIPEPTEAE